MGEAWVGPTSAFSREELAALSVNEIVQRLKSWMPSGELIDHSRAGVGLELAKVIAQDPAKFIERHVLFRELPPVYVRAVMEGLRDALSAANVAIDWSKAFELALWIATQSDGDLPDPTPWERRDPTWTSARKVWPT